MRFNYNRTMFDFVPHVLNPVRQFTFPSCDVEPIVIIITIGVAVLTRGAKTAMKHADVIMRMVLGRLDLHHVPWKRSFEALHHNTAVLMRLGVIAFHMNSHSSRRRSRTADSQEGC